MKAFDQIIASSERKEEALSIARQCKCEAEDAIAELRDEIVTQLNFDRCNVQVEYFGKRIPLAEKDTNKTPRSCVCIMMCTPKADASDALTNALNAIIVSIANDVIEHRPARSNNSVVIETWFIFDSI